MSSSSAYDRFGKPYNISRVITPSLTFDQKAYDAYSPLYLSTTFAMVYMLASAIATCVLVHAGIYYGRSLLRDMQKRNGDRDDVHARLMRVYPEWVTASPCSYLTDIQQSSNVVVRRILCSLCWDRDCQCRSVCLDAFVMPC